MPNNPAVLNPVLKGEIDLKPKEVPSTRTMIRLSNPENYALITWLQNYKQEPGDTIHVLARKAALELNNPKINYNHVQQRMQEFGITLVQRGVDNAQLIERVQLLENAVDALIDQVAQFNRDHGIPSAPAIQEYINERALRRR